MFIDLYGLGLSVISFRGIFALGENRTPLGGQYYSFFQLLKHDFEYRARLFKTLHTISTTIHTISRTPHILCKMKHYCKNYTLLYKKDILLPYENTHVSYD